jgi:hypothetical protein
MSVFSSPEQAREVFTKLFTILLEDKVFLTKMTDSALSLHLVQRQPDMELFVSPDGVVDGPGPRPAAIRIKMSCDTAHALWLGELMMPLAVATGRVRIKGNVPKVLEFVPILRPAFDQYAKIAAEYGIAA